MFYDLEAWVPLCFATNLLLAFVSVALSEEMDDIYQIGLVSKPPCGTQGSISSGSALFDKIKTLFSDKMYEFMGNNAGNPIKLI